MHKVDLIGDIHGQSDALSKMLTKLEFDCANGQWSHPEDRKLVFLGDLIDRGKKNRKVITTVRALVDQGVAICLMGNHEFNAVQYHTEHPVGSGKFLRPHSSDNMKNHKAFREEFSGEEKKLDEVIQWFASLPVAIETPDFRAVHACWSPEDLKTLRKDGMGWHMDSIPWAAAAEKGSAMYETIETLLKGPEKKLPNGLEFNDKDEKPRREARLAWWKKHPKVWKDAVDPSVDLKEHGELNWDGDFLSYPPDQKPVFFGHYWRIDDPKPDAHNAFCLDYSAGKDGHLTAYRFTAGHSSVERGEIIQIKV